MKFPSFNTIDKKIGIYCETHSLENMVCVARKRCSYDGCTKYPGYNTIDKTVGIFCASHKEKNMVNVLGRRCLHDTCLKFPLFNSSDKNIGMFCVLHREKTMVDVVTKRYCLYENCRKRANFNTRDNKSGIYCASHKENNMIDVVNKKCQTHLCDTTMTNKTYEGYCFRCFVHTFPEKPISRNYKTKEKYVVDHIREKFCDFEWIADRKIQDGCSKRRPDLLLDLGFQVIIIEIDEYAHSTYDSFCEARRVEQISQDLYHRNIIFIRFNPDSYVDSTGKKIPSCWSTNKLGLVVVSKTQEKKWINRLDILLNQIQFCVDNPTEKKIDTIELFY
jgi:hypothetical protein